MQFKKLAAIAGSALMTGLALTGPVLATSVTELGKIADMVTVTDSTVSFPVFVIGAGAATGDVAGALDVAVNMAANAKTTSTVTTEIPGESVTGGAKVATSGIFLEPYANPQRVKGIMTASDIPSLLGSGTFSSTTGGSFNYKQYIYLLGETDLGTSNPGTNFASVVFDRPTTENTPRLSFKVPSTKALWTYKLTFSTPVALSSATSTANLQAVLQGTTINIMGKDFIVSDCTHGGTTPNGYIQDITLLGGKNVVTVESGTPVTITSDGLDYTITLSSVVAETSGSTTVYTAIGDINGEAFSLRAGQTTIMADGQTTIAAIKVFQGKTGAADFAKIAIGADKIKLTRGSGSGSTTGTVTIGSTTATQLGSDIVSSEANGWSVLYITHTPQDNKWIVMGESIADPMSGAFNIKFNSVIPGLTDAANRQNIVMSPSGYAMYLKYKNAGDTEYNFAALYCDSCTSSSQTWRWASAPTTSPNWRDVAFDENMNISAVDQDYFVINKGGFSHVLRFTAFTNATKTYTFTDEAGNTITATGTQFGTGDTADLIVDGNTFKVYLVDPTATVKTINVDMNGDGAIAGNTSYYPNTAGYEYSYLVPKLITTGQGGLYFYSGNKTVSAPANGAKVAVEAGMIPLIIGNTTGTYYLYNGATSLGQISLSTINNVTGTSDSNYLDIVANCGASSCNVGLGTSVTGLLTNPGFVLVQEANQGGQTHNWLYTPILWDDTAKRPYAGITLYSDDTNYQDHAILGTNTQYKGMTTYGTTTDHLSTTLGGSATISYPDVFTYANLYLITPTGVISSGGVGGEVTTDVILPITSDVVKLDSEVTSSDKANYDMVLVGGPCINTLVAELASDGSFPYSCAGWPGRDFGRIQLIADAFASGKTVLVIAGTRMQDTDLAARIVQTGFPGATNSQKAASFTEVTGTVATPSYS